MIRLPTRHIAVHAGPLIRPPAHGYGVFAMEFEDFTAMKFEDFQLMHFES